MSDPIDRRRKNQDWIVADKQGVTYSEMRDGAKLAVLMDIRDELKQLNAVFACHNFQFMPHVLREIRDNTKARPPHRRLPKNIPALELAAKHADELLDVATRGRERVISALTEAYRRAKA